MGFFIMKKFLELLKVYKCIANTNTTTKMNTQRILDEEKVIGDLKEDLKAWTEDAVQIRTWREYFLKSIRRFFRK